MENIIFCAENDLEAREIAIKDFVNKAGEVLRVNYYTLSTIPSPHTAFYACYESMFSGKGSRWISSNKPLDIETISDTKGLLYKRVKSFISSEHKMIQMMGGGEYPFIYLEKVEENKYQYYIGQ